MSYDGVMALPPASWPGYPRSCPRAKADRIRPKRDTTADPVARHDARTPMHSRNHLRVPRASACICVRHFLPLSTQTPAAPTQTPASRSTTASNFSRRYAADARKARRCSEPSRRRQPVPTPHGSYDCVTPPAIVSDMAFPSLASALRRRPGSIAFASPPAAPAPPPDQVRWQAQRGVFPSDISSRTQSMFNSPCRSSANTVRVSAMNASTRRCAACVLPP